MRKSNFFTILFLGLLLLNWSPVKATSPEFCHNSEDAVTTFIHICGFGFESFAPVTKPPTTCEDDEVIIRMGPRCDGAMYMDVILVNLHGVNNAPSGAGPHPLPSGMPAIYVEYDSDLNGTYDSMSDPITSLNYEGWSMSRINGNHHVYKKRVYLDNNQMALCGPVINPFSTLLGNMTIRLMEKLPGGGFQLYNTGAYATPGGVMSCHIFHETCGACNPECGGLLPPVYEPKVCIDCDTECSEEEPAKLREYNAFDDLLADTPLVQKVSPNPFEDELNIQFTTQVEEAVQFTIIDIKGSIVQSHRLEAGVGQQQTRLDLSVLAPGVYHCQVKTAQKVETVKIVKNRR
ncbi:MAG: T9SS type A sorting domain-containing protein [Bacteroidota bacterium]